MADTGTHCSGDRLRLLLLNLPAEIKNRIYHYALVDEYRVTPENPHLPVSGLVRANRQLLSEAFVLWLHESDFHIKIVCFNGAFLVDFYQSIHAVSQFVHTILGISKPTSAPTKFSFMGFPNWPNSLRWLKAAHATGICQFPTNDKDALHNKSVDVCFAGMKIVSRMRYYLWEHVEEVLEAMHTVVANREKDWK